MNVQIRERSTIVTSAERSLRKWAGPKWFSEWTSKRPFGTYA